MRFIILLALCFASSAVFAQKARFGSLSQQSSYVVTNEVDALAMSELNGHIGPRIALLESGTNGWNAAYGWGNHAAAGYLLSSAWNTWLSTNTYVKTELDQTALAALAAFAATNNLIRWQDASEPSVWWEARGGTNLTAYRMVEVATNFTHHVDAFSAFYLGAEDVPFPTNTTDGATYSFTSYFLDGKCKALIDSINGTIEYVSESAEFPQTLVSGLGAPEGSFTQTVSIVSYVYATNVLASYNLTTGNVWQAVADVRQTAADAQFAADQAATLVNYHTALDAAPHAGKFVLPSQLTNNTSHIMAQWYAADGSLTQQIVRVGESIWTNRWPTGVTGAITNGMDYLFRIDTNYQGNMAIYLGAPYKADWDEKTVLGIPVKLWNSAGVQVGYFAGSDGGLNGTFYVGRNGGQGGSTDSTCMTFDNAGGILRQTAGNTVVNTIRAGGPSTIGGALFVGETNTAAVIVSQGPVFFGPVINGKQMFLDGDATNAWIVNVNSVTNAL